MFKKTVFGALLAAACCSAFGATYYVVVPVAKKPGATTPPTPPVENISVSLQQYALPSASVGEAYSPQDFKNLLLVTGDAAYNADNVSWTWSGALPTGVSFTGGMLSGTPTQAGNFLFTVAADYKGKSAQQGYELQAIDLFGTPAQLGYGMASAGYTWTATNGAAGKYGVFTNVGINKGRWYAEVELDDNYSAGTYAIYEIGVTNNPTDSAGRAWFAEVPASTAMGVYIHPYSAYFCSYTHCAPGMTNVSNVVNPSFYWLKGDVLGVAINADNNSIAWYRNGTKIYETLNITTPKPWHVGASSAYKPSAAGLKFNFGQQAFKYAAPSGYRPGIGSAAQ